MRAIFLVHLILLDFIALITVSTLLCACNGRSWKKRGSRFHGCEEPGSGLGLRVMLW
jgi:hypothetical protein